MIKKRLLSGFLVLCTLIGMMPSMVFALTGEGEESDDVIRIEPFIDTEDSENPGEDIYNMYASQTTISVYEDGLVTP